MSVPPNKVVLTPRYLVDPVTVEDLESVESALRAYSYHHGSRADGLARLFAFVVDAATVSPVGASGSARRILAAINAELPALAAEWEHLNKGRDAW